MSTEKISEYLNSISALATSMLSPTKTDSVQAEKAAGSQKDSYISTLDSADAVYPSDTYNDILTVIAQNKASMGNSADNGAGSGAGGTNTSGAAVSGAGGSTAAGVSETDTSGTGVSSTGGSTAAGVSETDTSGAGVSGAGGGASSEGSSEDEETTTEIVTINGVTYLQTTTTTDGITTVTRTALSGNASEN